MRKSLGLCLGLAIFAQACNSSKKASDATSRVASISIGGFTAKPGDPAWELLKLDVKRMETKESAIAKEYPLSAFKESKLNDISVKVEFGRYTMLMEYFDKGNQLVYQSCADERTREHIIEQAVYETVINICKEGSNKPSGQITIRPSAEVTLTPTLEGGETPTPSTPVSTASCRSPNGQTLAGHDDVYGTCVDQKSGWSVQGGEILFKGQAFTLKGINWFGFDSADNKLHGLWSGRSIDSFLDQLQDLGFNALRVPLSPQTLTANTSVDGGHGTPRDQLKALLAATEKRKMAVLLDMHTCDVNAGHLTGTPEASVCRGYKKQNWLNDLKALATLAKPYSYVVGIDLYNEPHALSWTTWRAWASEAGEVILKENPRILAFVEGVGSAEGTPYGNYGPFYGENLFEAVSRPVTIPGSRLVFSPHAYGPSVFDGHDYFKSAAFPSNMPAVWDEHFGYLRDKNYAIAVGEFGGTYVGADKVWQDAFVQYLVKKKIKHFFYWSFNPNSGDTGGLLKDDWRTVNQVKYDVLKPLLK